MHWVAKYAISTWVWILAFIPRSIIYSKQLETSDQSCKNCIFPHGERRSFRGTSKALHQLMANCAATWSIDSEIRHMSRARWISRYIDRRWCLPRSRFRVRSTRWICTASTTPQFTILFIQSKNMVQRVATPVYQPQTCKMQLKFWIVLSLYKWTELHHYRHLQQCAFCVFFPMSYTIPIM